MTDVAQIVAGLTKAQREALLRHPDNRPYGTPTRGWPQSARDPTSFCYAGRALMDKGIIVWTSPTSSSTRLTPLGLAVRTALLSKEGESADA